MIVPVFVGGRAATVAGSAAQSGATLAFALVRTPVAAAACYVFAWAAYGLHRSGFSANLVRH